MSNAISIAKILLSIKAISINAQEPFRYASGLLSPIYCDNRLVISYPEQRQQIINAFLESIAQQAGEFDVVAGTATAGIPHAAWIADRLNKPMVYIRSSAKSHGKQNQIEGHIHQGQTAIVIEDLISTGGSALHAIDTLRQAGINASQCFAITTYNFKAAIQNFKDQQAKCYCLTDFEQLIKAAQLSGELSEAECELVQQWNQDPKAWEALYNQLQNAK